MTLSSLHRLTRVSHSLQSKVSQLGVQMHQQHVQTKNFIDCLFVWCVQMSEESYLMISPIQIKEFNKFVFT